MLLHFNADKQPLQHVMSIQLDVQGSRTNTQTYKFQETGQSMFEKLFNCYPPGAQRCRAQTLAAGRAALAAIPRLQGSPMQCFPLPSGSDTQTASA
eukprot:6470633-Amphidinium_carterae.1